MANGAAEDDIRVRAAERTMGGSACAELMRWANSAGLEGIAWSLLEGCSMEPNLRASDVLLTATNTRRRDQAPRPGQMVQVRSRDDSETLLKRFVAGPSSTVRMDRTGLSVNGRRWLTTQHEQKVRTQPPHGHGFEIHPSDTNDARQWRLTAAEIFVLGDNRGQSADSSNEMQPGTDEGLLLADLLPAQPIAVIHAGAEPDRRPRRWSRLIE